MALPEHYHESSQIQTYHNITIGKILSPFTASIRVEIPKLRACSTACTICSPDKEKNEEREKSSPNTIL